MPNNVSYEFEVTQALWRLSALANQAGTVIEIALCHGAAVALAYRIEGDGRHEVRANDVAHHLARLVSEELRLRTNWLLTDAAIFIAESAGAKTWQPHAFAPGVLLSTGAAVDVLARKLHVLQAPLPPAATDAEDAEFLLEKVRIWSPGQVKFVYRRAFPEGRLSVTAQELIDRVCRARITTEFV